MFKSIGRLRRPIGGDPDPSWIRVDLKPNYADRVVILYKITALSA